MSMTPSQLRAALRLAQEETRRWQAAAIVASGAAVVLAALLSVTLVYA